MRTKFVFPGLMCGTRIAIYDMARCFWNVFGGAGPYLNQWAENPQKPHPHVIKVEHMLREHSDVLDNERQQRASESKQTPSFKVD